MKLSHLSVAVFSAIALAACGGSGSDHTKTPGGTPGGTPGDDEHSTTPTKELSSDVVAALTNQAGLTNYYGARQNRQFPGQGAATTRVNNPVNAGANAASLLTLTNQKAFIKNPSLYNESGNLDGFNAVATSTEVAYLDDSGNFQFAEIAQTAAGTPFRYFKNNGAAGTADLSAPLEAADLYQAADLVDGTNVAQSGNAATPAGNSFTNVTGFKVFDQSFTKPAPSAAQFGTIDRTKIKTGELVTAPVYAQVQFTAAKIAPVLNGAAQANNVTQADSDGEPAVIQETKDFKVGDVKAYNLPHSLTTVSAYEKGAAGVGAFFQANYTAQNVTGLNPFASTNSVVQVTGLRTLDLPQNAKATYTGKVFSADSQGDISLDVEFGTTNSAYVKNVKITNRSDSTNSSLKSMVGVAPAAVNYAGAAVGANFDDYTVNLVAEDGVNPTAPEYQSLGGKFYGPNAEETAGALYANQNGTNVVNQVTGAFAAQRGELSK